jgi:membrane-bound metal-dependent hydrolase YbcI (DUF457 family)
VITGHFGLAAGAEAAEPRAPLWSLMLATMWLDVVFTPLYLAGVETIETPPGGGYGSSTIHADYTHSLVGALVLSAIFGAVAVRPWGRRAGVVLAAVAFSHWVLDLLVHRADLPILPGNAGGLPLLGFACGVHRQCRSCSRRPCWSAGSTCTGAPHADTPARSGAG